MIDRLQPPTPEEIGLEPSDSWFSPEDLETLVSGLPSVEMGGRAMPDKISMIAIVGPSCVGKTHILRPIRREQEQGQYPQLEIAQRTIQRPPRDGEDLQENVGFSNRFAVRDIRQPSIGPRLFKPAGDSGVEIYSFTNPEPGKTSVLPANMGLLHLPKLFFPRYLLEDALIIGVYAPDDVRAERFAQRSADILSNDPEQARYRLGDSADGIGEQVNLVFNNFGNFSGQVESDALRLFEYLNGVASETLPTIQTETVQDPRGITAEFKERQEIVSLYLQVYLGAGAVINDLSQYSNRSEVPHPEAYEKLVDWLISSVNSLVTQTHDRRSFAPILGALIQLSNDLLGHYGEASSEEFLKIIRRNDQVKM